MSLVIIINIFFIQCRTR